jgi:DNA-binding HxlR family transcriptional regulator
MDSSRVYRHFCMTARALEVVGERWTLLVVRDLLFGARRFTDLHRSLAEITPARLTARLRQLEAAGVVTRERPAGGREVWYRLTAAGRDLEPVVDALTLWGIEHAFDRPRPDEPVHSAPAMIGTKVVLTRRDSAPAHPVTWVWRFTGDDEYTIRGDRTGWTLARGHDDRADVIVDTTPEAWARLLTSNGPRQLPQDDIELTGKPADVRLFVRAFGAPAVKRPSPDGPEHA